MFSAVLRGSHESQSAPFRQGRVTGSGTGTGPAETICSVNSRPDKKVSSLAGFIAVEPAMM
jgi:hypothetical protein